MGKIYVIMGKSSSGKDTIFKLLLEQMGKLWGENRTPRTVVIYTTRPMRPGEQNGTEYFFSTEEELQKFREEGRIIEERRFDTVHGPWYYFTVNDGQINLAEHDYLMINTLAGYEMIRDYYKEENGEENVIPIYIEADAKERLLRYINRESMQQKPNYSEVCRRFLADEEDFAEEKLTKLGINHRYFNEDLERCCQKIMDAMQ